MPFESPREEAGVLIPSTPEKNYYVAYNNDVLASLTLVKADSSIEYKRSFYKVD